MWSQAPVNLQQLLKKMDKVQLQYKSPGITAFKHISQVSPTFSVIMSSFFYFLPPTGTQKNLLGGRVTTFPSDTALGISVQQCLNGSGGEQHPLDTA